LAISVVICGRNIYIVDSTRFDVEKKADSSMKERIKYKTVVVSESTHKKLMDYSKKAGISNSVLIDIMIEFCREQDLEVVMGFKILAKLPKGEHE
jgi:hypothetical protein